MPQPICQSSLSAMQFQPSIVATVTSYLPPSKSAQVRPCLPRLPVPDLHSTLQQYIASLQPFLLSVEQGDNSEEDYKESLALRAKWAEEFGTSIGMVCQERLKSLDLTSPHNWLDDNIWLQKGYHQRRVPLMIDSNWWAAFTNDPNVPRDVLLGIADNQGGIDGTGVTGWQVRRAAWLAWRLLDFKGKMDRQELHPSTTETGLWFRSSMSRMFNISRLPHTSCDTFSSLPSPDLPTARNLLICVRDWFYTIEVLDAEMNLINVKDLEKRLMGVVLDVANRLRSSEKAVPVGVLGSDGRDKWSENLAYLLTLAQSNKDTLAAINHSLFAVSLDHYTYGLPSPTSVSELLPTSPRLSEWNSLEEVDAHLHNLRSSHPSQPAHNRWFDKTFTLIVESNTRAGANGEHSALDALVPSMVAEYAVVQGMIEKAFGGPVGDENCCNEPESEKGWKRQDWLVDNSILQECLEAEERAKEAAEDSDHSVLCFDAYGANWIKNDACLSPDAYVQMAMQLAWYRTQGTFTATYETTLTRMFHHGRTETIRTLSFDSRAWVLAMMDSSSVQTQYSLLQKAVKTHSTLSRAAATGRGIDRHLLGLRCMLRPEDGEAPSLFKDELFSRSQSWKLSTSALGAGSQFRGTGFGAVERDGYGINYLTGSDTIKFGIECKRSSPLTSTGIFKQALVEALHDMQYVCLGATMTVPNAAL